MSSVCVIGNLTWDRLVEVPVIPLPNRDYLTIDDATHAGGAGGNVAAGLALLGVPAAMIAAVGRDRRGDDLVDDLERYGVDVSLLQRPDLPTSEFLCLIDPDGNRSFLLDAEQAAFALEAPPALPDEAGCAFVGCQVGLAREMLEREPIPRGRVFANIGFWIAAGELEAEEAEILNEIECLFLNNDEFEGLSDPVRRKITSPDFLTGGRQVVITGGAAEAVVLSESNSTALAPAPPPLVVNTLGCGDGFMAGYLAGYLAGQDIELCLRLAHECAGRVAGSRQERWPEQFDGIPAVASSE
jgi:sugar/nucleoside kinase (ribokinase family)